MTEIFYHYISFPLGFLFLAKNTKGLIISKFVEDKKLPENWLSKLIKLDKYKFKYSPELFSQEIKLFNSYFRGKTADFSCVKIDLIFGSPWERKVWLQTKKIPYGEVRTYKFIAEKLNSRGFRAVGRALGKNPLLIIIPCHRVIKTDGSIGGFSAGIKLKKYLLKLEKIF